MKQGTIVRISLYLIAMSVLIGMAIVIYSFGYQKGSLDVDIRRLPFDFHVYLQLYDMGSYIRGETISPPEFRHSNSKMLLYTRLKFLEATQDRFGKIGVKGLCFDDNVARAREVVKDLELVNLKDVLDEMLLENDIKIHRESDD